MADAAFLMFDGGSLYFEAVTTEQAEHTAEATEHAVEKGANVSDHVRDALDRVTLEVVVSNTPLVDVNGWYGEALESVPMAVRYMKTEPLSTELDVPKYSAPLVPTPGALINAAAGAIGDLISGKPSYKVQGEKKTPASVNVGPLVKTFKSKAGSSIVKDVMTILDSWKKRAVVGEVVTEWKHYKSMIITKVTPRRTAATGDAAEITIELREIRIVNSKQVTAPKEVSGMKKVSKGRQQPKDLGPNYEPPEKVKSVLKAWTAR